MPDTTLPDATVAVDAATPFMRLVKDAGFDAVALRNESLRLLLPKYDVAPESLVLDGARVPHALTIEQLERSAWLLGTESIALRALRYWQLGDQGVGDYLNATAATLGDFLRLTTQFVPLLHDGIRFKLEIGEEEARFTYELDEGIVPHRWYAEVTLGKMVAEARRGLGAENPLPLRAVHFQHEAPVYEREYQGYFGAPIEFDRGENALVFDVGALSVPFVTADPVLHGIVRQHATNRLRARPIRQSFMDRVREIARDELPKSSADQSEVARRLGISPATLRRRLEQGHGARYADLVAALRREVATHCLDEGNLSIDDVGIRAGFAQKTAFYRAFKRWYGVTPAAYRRASGGR